MWEYVMKNVDINQDCFVILEEFFIFIQRKEFGDIGEGWEIVEMYFVYIEEELRCFEEELVVWEVELNVKVQCFSQEIEVLGWFQGCLEVQKRELQQVVLYMEQ